MNDENLIATTSIVCGVVLEHNGKYLLVQEKQPKAYGKWSLPGGRVDAGETLEQAAVREAKEETGFDVQLGEELLVLHTVVEKPVLHTYAATIVGGDLAFPPDEILDAGWFSYDEIIKMKDLLRNQVYVIGSIEKFQQRGLADD
jgi:ADP-ribose pyrophosphatase YjhB (NUDIX family)